MPVAEVAGFSPDGPACLLVRSDRRDRWASLGFKSGPTIEYDIASNSHRPALPGFGAAGGVFVDGRTTAADHAGRLIFSGFVRPQRLLALRRRHRTSDQARAHAALEPPRPPRIAGRCTGALGIATDLARRALRRAPADARAGADRPPRRHRHDRVLHQRRRDASCRAAPTPTASTTSSRWTCSRASTVTATGSTIAGKSRWGSTTPAPAASTAPTGDPDGDGLHQPAGARRRHAPARHASGCSSPRASRTPSSRRASRIANPATTDATAVVRLDGDDGASSTAINVLRAGRRAPDRVRRRDRRPRRRRSRRSIESNGVPIVTDRTMSWDRTGYGAHAERASDSAPDAWFLAEGATGALLALLPAAESRRHGSDRDDPLPAAGAARADRADLPRCRRTRA